MQIDQTYAHADHGGGLTSKIDKRDKMAYTALAEAKIGDDDQISLYAVIIDAGSPYKNNAHNKFICTMKVVDQTLHSTTSAANKKV